MSAMLDTLREFLDALPDPGAPRRIVCGRAILDWFQSRGAPPVIRPGEPDLVGLLGVPIVLDPNMARGRWELRVGDEVIQRGQVGDGVHVWYAPGRGFITLPDEPDSFWFDRYGQTT